MSQATALQGINLNPLAFEELAMSLSSLISYIRSGDMGAPIAEFERLYQRALHQPPSYAEVTELTGQGLSAGDRRSGRAAWLLKNIENLDIYGVHSLVWHKVGKKYTAPLLDQMSRALGLASRLSDADLQSLGKESSLLDVLGVKDGSIWLVQAISEKKINDSALLRTSSKSGSLFRTCVFRNSVLEGPSLSTLYNAYDVVRRAFPSVDVFTLGLVLHPSGPDFELYQIELGKNCPQRVVLTEDRIRKNSIDYADKLKEDQESLWMLPERLDDELFRGIPPCRGGRTLGMLASMAKRQLASQALLQWKERQFSDMLKDDFNLEVPRDKVRHDLVDRLVLQGFMRKWGNVYFLTPKGIARYLYCLAKYTTKGTDAPMNVLEACSAQRDKIVANNGCL